jgi:hypothetical protein
MRGLDATELLAVWEAGASADRARRAALLLAVASPEADAALLTRLPVGERNRRLLALRAATFGLELETRAACPACAAELEARIAIADLLTGQDGPPVRLALPAGEGAIEVRLPGSDDLAAVAGLAPLPAAQALLARCRLDAIEEDPSPELAEAFAALVEAADPLAEIELDLRCQDCGHGFARCLEVVAFLWREVEMQALRLLTEVHTLARAYGWTEREILGLSARRRAYYLQWVAG